MKTKRFLLLLSSLLALRSWAFAQAPQSAPTQQASIIHVPPAQWEAGETATLKVKVTLDWKLLELWVSVRAEGDAGPYTRVELERATDDSFAAQIPGSLVQPPGVEYYISSKNAEGEVRDHFGSAEAPHEVVVQGETALTLRKERLARHRGHLSSFRMDTEITAYGSRLDPTSGATTDSLSDTFWDLRLEYTRRLLTRLYDIRFGLGLLRGQQAEVTGSPLIAGQPEPGLDYGYGEVNFELARNFSLGARLTLGASGRGFTGGVGGLIRIGRIAGTHLELGGDIISDLGGIAFLDFTWHTIPKVPMGLTIEVTKRPDPILNPQGERLLYDIGFEATDRITLHGKIGYAVRAESLESGIVGGLTAVYEY